MKNLLELYWTFVRIGCVTFGGGYAMLPILERELVDKRHWTTMAPGKPISGEDEKEPENDQKSS